MIAVFAIVWFTSIYLFGGLLFLVNYYLPIEDEALQQFATLMKDSWDDMINDIGPNGVRSIVRIFVVCIWPYGLYQYLRMSK